MNAQKAALRRAALRRRAEAAAAGGVDATSGEALAAAVLPAARGAARVAAYASFGTEPSTSCLLPALTGLGAQVLLPVVLPDRDLDWTHAGAGPRLGVDAVATCALVVVPALAVDRRGHRLGRGGGSYDRALARLPAGVLVVALLHDGELVASLPAEPHDVPVHAVVTPSGGLVHL